ncbi:MAG: hypothetical protein KHY08_12050 [Lachnospiraceae bacterium]|nr:hypothetical protein [Lachnospiraceae bacterium]
MIGIIYSILAVISGYFISSYLHFKFQYLVGIGFFCLIIACIRRNRKQNFLTKSKRFIIIAFSILLSFAIVLGDHIHVEDAYTGTTIDNYIVPYTVIDLLALIFIALGIYEIVKCIYFFSVKFKSPRIIQFSMQNKISVKSVVIVLACLLVLWLPYLFVYYPGFIFGDTLYSILQAIGGVALDNHHPVFYTLFIKFCLKLGNILGGSNTVGCVIYCIFQMLYMGICISYLSCWLYFRMKLPKKFLVILIMFYGITPYFAQMSIAMWKDPIFSVTLAVLTVMLMDVLLSKGEILEKNLLFEGVYIILLCILIFVRNNGIYISFFMAFIFFVMWIIHRKKAIKKAWKKLGICTIVIVIVSQIIVGPVYNKLGVGQETVESYGIFLNQMARVVACEGKMSEEDQNYMDQLLPIDLYKTTYTPCCVDLLKWNQEFDGSALENDFFKRYLSMLLKNPRIFFEGWVLQTYGYWTVNCDEINYYSANITGGIPRNLDSDIYQEELNMYGIKLGGYANDEMLTKAFPVADWAIPIGIINWWVLFVVVFIILKEQNSLMVVLAPTVGLIITLIVASPISYWPRYAAAEQYLLPFYIALFIIIFGKRLYKEEKINGQNSYFDSLL